MSEPWPITLPIKSQRLTVRDGLDGRGQRSEQGERDLTSLGVPACGHSQRRSRRFESAHLHNLNVLVTAGVPSGRPFLVFRLHRWHCPTTVAVAVAVAVAAAPRLARPCSSA